MSKPHTPARSGPIRNIRAFLSAYMKSEAGQNALNRKPFNVKGEDGKYKMIFRTSQMADAFQKALG